MPIIIIENIEPIRALSCCSAVGVISSEPFINHNSERINSSKRMAISILQKSRMNLYFDII